MNFSQNGDALITEYKINVLNECEKLKKEVGKGEFIYIKIN